MPGDGQNTVRQELIDKVASLADIAVAHGKELVSLEERMNGLSKTSDDQEKRIRATELSQAMAAGKGYVITGIVAAVGSGLLATVANLLTK